MTERCTSEDLQKIVNAMADAMNDHIQEMEGEGRALTVADLNNLVAALYLGAVEIFLGDSFRERGPEFITGITEAAVDDFQDKIAAMKSRLLEAVQKGDGE